MILRFLLDEQALQSVDGLGDGKRFLGGNLLDDFVCRPVYHFDDGTARLFVNAEIQGVAKAAYKIVPDRFLQFLRRGSNLGRGSRCLILYAANALTLPD